MAPVFQTIKSFADVPITDAAVDTVAFLEAADGVVKILDLLFGKNPALTFVISDLVGNIKKVRQFHEGLNKDLTEGETERGATLEQLISSPGAKGTKESLMWLLRGLAFTCCALRISLDKPNEPSLSPCFTRSYDQTLKKHHNFVVRGVVSVALMACPKREEFYEKLANDPEGGPSVPNDELKKDMDAWLTALENILKHMRKSYNEKDIPDPTPSS